MQNTKFEVIFIRKIHILICAFFLALGVLALSGQAHAADIHSHAGTVQTAQGRLNVRSGPSSGTPAITTLPKGSLVTLISRSGDWWKVEYAPNRYGYCHADYIRQAAASPALVSTASGNLNVRAGAGTGYAKTGSLPKDTVVLILSQSGGWSRILYGGTKTGYVSSAYLSQPGHPAIHLTVPSYKQMDSRWANTYIGSSGKTIAKIGCAPTAVAMLESYRTGTVIYPDAMSKKLRYTPSGSLYWPEDYRVVTSQTDLLSGIYAQLQAGKPVLFGARNAAGGQHWVVITGFTGGQLTYSSFTVHDPGSTTRHNLRQLLDRYPTFNKYFTY